MKLFHVTRTDRHRCYETFSGFVACAPDEETARMMDPGCRDGTLCQIEESTGRLILTDDDGLYLYEDGTWAATLSDVKVEYIGEAAPGMTAKVILSDWNEG